MSSSLASVITRKCQAYQFKLMPNQLLCLYRKQPCHTKTVPFYSHPPLRIYFLIPWQKLWRLQPTNQLTNTHVGEIITGCSSSPSLQLSRWHSWQRTGSSYLPLPHNPKVVKGRNHKTSRNLTSCHGKDHSKLRTAIQYLNTSHPTETSTEKWQKFQCFQTLTTHPVSVRSFGLNKSFHCLPLHSSCKNIHGRKRASITIFKVVHTGPQIRHSHTEKNNCPGHCTNCHTNRNWIVLPNLNCNLIKPIPPFSPLSIKWPPLQNVHCKINIITTE